MTLLTRPPFRADFKERSRSANAKIQQSASTSEGCPAASCCERRLAKGSATADLQVPNRKQRRASLSASIGDQHWPRAVRRPHTHRSRADHPAGNARAHTRHSPPRPADSIGSCRGRPESCAPAPPIESAGRGAALVARISQRHRSLTYRGGSTTGSLSHQRPGTER
jgi:hypothetical protein